MIRLINFKDSRYEIPRTVRDLDLRGLTGHVVLLEGVKTGTANVSEYSVQNYGLLLRLSLVFLTTHRLLLNCLTLNTDKFLQRLYS